MIYNIRGTSGSGKTTVVRQLVNSVEHEVVQIPWGKKQDKTKIIGYRLLNDLYVVGRYDDAIKGGGVDNVTGILTKKFHDGGGEGNSMDAVEHAVRELHEEGKHVLFEGLIVTSVWGRWVKMADEIPVHFLFLDTPLEVCYQRVLERSGGRSPKGWNEGKSDLENKHKSTTKQMASIKRRDGEVKRQQSSLEDFHGRQTKRHIPAAQAEHLHHSLLDHKRAFIQLRKILEEEIEFPHYEASYIPL